MEYLITGYIRTAHGVKGFVKVHLFQNDPVHFLKVHEVLLRKDAIEKKAVVEAVQVTGFMLLVKFDCITTPEEGRAYSGWEIWIPRAECAVLDKDEFYQADIVGCSVLCDSKETGKVLSVIEGGQAPLLEVETDSGIRLVPFLKQFVTAVDMDSRRIELIGEWILE